MKTVFKLILIVIFFNSCNSRQKDIQVIINEWQGKDILLPQQIAYKVLGRDTVCSDLWNKPYKIFTYVDSIGCSSCQMRLDHWKSIIDLFTIQQLDVAVIFVVHSSNYKLLDKDLIANDFNHPIIYDYYDKFNKINHFPPIPYRTFLLDKDNKVKLLGSPLDSPEIWELYKKVITQSIF